MLNSCLFHRNGFSWLKMNKNSVDCQATAGKLIKPVRLREWLCENNPDEENTFLKKKVSVCGGYEMSQLPSLRGPKHPHKDS